MSRDRELTMEIEVAGRSFNEQKEKLALTPWPSAKPIFHFRRWEGSWNEFMKGDFDGFHETREDDFKYGFDWLGDDYYDFGKTDDLNKRAGRYNYIYNDVFNSIKDPGDSGKKVPIVMEDKNIESNESLLIAKYKYKAIFQKDAKLYTLNEKDYFPSWVTIRQGKTVSLLVGYRNYDVTVGPQFGDNDDSFHIVAEPGYENHFEISAPEIKKEDLNSNGLPLDITCKNVINRDVSILVYHTDNCTIKSPDGTIDLAKYGTLVGELRVMKNNIEYMLDVVLVRVQRKNTADFANSTLNDLRKLQKTMGRAFSQASINCSFSVQTLSNCKDSNQFIIPDEGNAINHNEYKQYINNKFLYEEYKASLTNTTPISFSQFKNNHHDVRSNFEGTTKKRFILYLHTYYHRDGIYGSADEVEENIQSSDKGKWAILYNDGTSYFVSGIHEAAHSMGLAHSFNSYQTKKTSCFDNNDRPDEFSNVDVYPSGELTYYFHKRTTGNKHLLRRGCTENIMDYNNCYFYNQDISVDYLKGAPPEGRPVNDITENNKRYKTKTPLRFHTIPLEGTPPKKTIRKNSMFAISFYKWQWELLQTDDEVVSR
ncbi:hypothetical protein I2486_19705 [Cellulophaga sp. E16_2]|uniref:Uncharacterized protein n=1 Tax=Cellulophaga algicola (strain DSM 14237 / IC166 / ACAM 630) TaxID=688270 RepID=E6XD52_CELAD|nr:MULTISPECIES: hypothetical protein [Cellulophaga]ADV51239.1 hypothetical protein Celal_3995 [Cellulophaga algicola DSM 14237]MBO0593630.1 hypothetical protein [Cellulophaga sp. E16_2]